MSILLTSKTVRVALNAGSYGGFIDQLTNGPVKFPFADLRIEVGLFFGKVNTTLGLVDLSNIVSLTCTVKAPAANGGAPEPATANLMQATVLAAEFDAAMTAEQWAALTGYHVAFDFTEAQVNNIPAAGAVHVVFTALLDSGKVIPIQWGPMEAMEDGYASAGEEPAVQDTAYTKAESNALYASAAVDGTNAKRGVHALTSGLQTGAIAFATEFAAPPASLQLTVEMPDGAAGVLAASFHSLDETGFTYVLTADAPAAGYKLHWRAHL